MSTQRKYDAILSDIEGTTTSISFVKDVLFPYCAENVQEYLKKHINDDSFKHVIDGLIAEYIRLNQSDSSVNVISDSKDYKGLAENVRYFIKNDLKLTALKELQGKMWIDGYKSGAYTAHVYDDTVPFFQRLQADKIPLFIYSSGSVLAQKLLFEHTEKGDLSKFISDYYDTNFGAKTDPESYKKIAVHTRIEASKILFLTDVDKEAYAAKTAGFNVILVIRDGNAPLIEECKKDFSTISSFEELII